MRRKLIIKYVSWGGHPGDSAHKWEASFSDTFEVFDYGSKQQHIQAAIDNGWDYVVLRTHRDGRTTVMESRSLAQ